MDQRIRIGMSFAGWFNVNNSERYFVSRVVEIVDTGCYRLGNGNCLYYHNMGLWLYGPAPWCGGATRLNQLVSLSLNPYRIVPGCATIWKAMYFHARAHLLAVLIRSIPLFGSRFRCRAK